MIEQIKLLNILQTKSKALIKRLDKKITDFKGPEEAKINIIKIVEQIKSYLNNLLNLDINPKITNTEIKEELEQIYYNKRQEIKDIKTFIKNKEYKYNILKSNNINILSEITMLYLWSILHQKDSEPVNEFGISLEMLNHYLNINIDIEEIDLTKFFEKNNELYLKIKYDIETGKYQKLFTEEDFKYILEEKIVKPLEIESPFTYDIPGEECELISKTFKELSNLIGFKLYEKRIPLTREDLVKEFNLEYKLENLIEIPTIKNINEVIISDTWRKEVDKLINDLEDINKMIKTLIKSKNKEDKLSIIYRDRVEEYLSKDRLFNTLLKFKGMTPEELEEYNEYKYKNAYETMSTLLRLTNENVENLLKDNALDYIKNKLDNNEILINLYNDNELTNVLENKLEVISLMSMQLENRDITKEAAINIIYREFYPILNDML